MDNSQVMTVARVFEPTEEGVEVVFLESAMFYRLESENPAFDSILGLLKDARANGRPVRVDIAAGSDNVIEGAAPLDQDKY